MRLGFHLSIAGSLSLALRQARVLGCQALQIFVANPRQWRWREVPPQEIRQFAAARRAAGLAPLVVHLSYLPNLASADPELQRLSRRRLLQELARARELEADYLVCHPGHGSSDDADLHRVAQALAQAVHQIPPPPLVLLENTAGQGQELGWTPAHLGRIRALSRVPLGLCLDTAHAYAAGYDLACPAGLGRLLGELARETGLEAIKIVHLNDSRSPLGSRVDRHQHLGQGGIGLPGLQRLFTHPWLNPRAVIMETPKRHPADDWRNLLVARHLAAGASHYLNGGAAAP